MQPAEFIMSYIYVFLGLTTQYWKTNQGTHPCERQIFPVSAPVI